ncbi:MAG TPA: MFS transporter [Vicinamibacterales bacterium]|nr:MFS transporter [Vicinamibacterales bacterium]
MSPLVIIFITVFIDLLGFGIIIPLLPFYAESFGATAFTIGLLGSVFSLMQFIVAPFCGRWSDRIGRRPIILGGLLASCIAYVALALADSLMLLFAARVLGGIAGGNIPTAQAYIADITTPENRAKGMGLVGAAFGLGFIFGPALGGILTRFGPSTPMWFAAALCLANFIAAWFLLPESRVGQAETRSLGRLDLFRRARRHAGLFPLLFVFFLVSMAFSGFEATFALFSERRFGFTAETIGYIFAFIGVVLAIVNGLIVSRAVPRFGEKRIVPFAIATIALGIVLVPAAHSVPVLFAVCGILAVGMGFNNPALTSAISRLSDPTEQGGMLGLAQSLAALGRIVGPAWGGYLFDHAGMTTPYFSGAAVMTAALILAIIALRRAELSRSPAVLV